MSAEIHPFACARAHPQRGEAVLCKRQTAHAGHHRGNDGERLLEWTDMPAPAPAGDAELLALPSALEGEEFAGEIVVRWDPRLLLDWLILVAVVVFLPPLAAIAYRAAF